MTETMARAVRRVEELTLRAVESAFRPLSGHYLALGGRSPRA